MFKIVKKLESSSWKKTKKGLIKTSEPKKEIKKLSTNDDIYSDDSDKGITKTYLYNITAR